MWRPLAARRRMGREERMTGHWIGVDPGSQDGALAVLMPDCRRIVLLAVYTEVADGYRVRTWTPQGQTCSTWPTLAGAGEDVASRVMCQTQHVSGLVIEALYTSPKPGARQAIVPLAEACGEWTAGIRRRVSPGLVKRVLAARWRAHQLGGSPRGVTADAWEARAVARAAQVWPEFDAAAAGWTKAERGAAAEACWMAREGATSGPRAHRGEA